MVNQVHPAVAAVPPAGPLHAGLALLAALGERDQRDVAALERLLSEERLVRLPLLAAQPTGLRALTALGREASGRLYRTAAT